MFGKKKPEVLVVGAGPVGLFTAIALAKKGVQVAVIDKEWRPTAHSYALALHAHSLKLFESLELLPPILRKGYRVRKINLYDGEQPKAEIRISDLEEDFSFLAVLRQDELESFLIEALEKLGVKVQWNHQLAHLRPQNGAVHVTVQKLDKVSLGYAVAHTEWEVAKTYEYEVPFVVGADGHRSFVRRALDIDYQQLGMPLHFAVFEFKTDYDPGDEMHLVFHEDTQNVLWPLPLQFCRWSFQLLDYEAPESSRDKDRFGIQIGSARFPVLDEAHLHQFITERAPWFRGKIRDIIWRIVVRFEKRLVDRFGRGRVWLVGDAAHMTYPVGIQSMNVGFREGYELAAIIADALQGRDVTGAFDAFNRKWLEEWAFLMGEKGRPRSAAQADPFIRSIGDKMVSSLPASGEDLRRLARMLQLQV